AIEQEDQKLKELEHDLSNQEHLLQKERSDMQYRWQEYRHELHLLQPALEKPIVIPTLSDQAVMEQPRLTAQEQHTLVQTLKRHIIKRVTNA
ncbi:MAG TPA: hypothetical protein VHA52_06205, partial [Candidatus Babeliaceae bacterium]|nr:hypothetical protein [Candidatus Babeliaceae bacterium]